MRARGFRKEIVDLTFGLSRTQSVCVCVSKENKGIQKPRPKSKVRRQCDDADDADEKMAFAQREMAKL